MNGSNRNRINSKMLMLKASFFVVIAFSALVLAQSDVPAEPEMAAEQTVEPEAAETEQTADLSEESEEAEQEQATERTEETEAEEPEQAAEQTEEPEAEETEQIAEEPQETPLPIKKPRFARNTVTVDISPLVVGIGLSQIGSIGESLFKSEFNPSSTGFGIGALYERMINEKFGIVGRAEYMQFSLNLTADDPSLFYPINVWDLLYEDEHVQHIAMTNAYVTNAYLSTTLSVNIWNVEAQARYYLLPNSFYIGGMLGFAGMAIGYEEEVSVSYNRDVNYVIFDKDTYNYIGIEQGSDKETSSVSVKPWRNYIKIGPLVGWRSAFGGPRGGFVWETYFGYHIALGLGDKYGDRLFGTAKKENLMGSDNEINQNLEDIVDKLELLFMGGPRLSSSIGWRF